MKFDIVKSKISKVKQLEAGFGCKWEYIPFFGWTSEEKNLSVYYVSRGIDDEYDPFYGRDLRIYGPGYNGDIVHFDGTKAYTPYKR